MVDIKQLRTQPDAYQDSAKRRGIKVDIAKLLELDAKRTKLVGEIDELRAKLNVKGKPSKDELKALHKVKAKLETEEKKLRVIEEDFADLLVRVPNLIADGTPDGGEEANRQESTWGEAKPAAAGAKDHLELALERDWLDFERGAKVAGAKFYFGKNEFVKLEMAVMNLVFDELTKRGFTLISVPHLVSARVMAGTGFLPRGEEPQVYQVADEDLNLIATAEIPLTGYHADEILDLEAGPRLYAALSPAYRREAGAYGKYSKGLYRVHQFNKIEMYVYCRPEDSAEWHDKLMAAEEAIARLLEIPYRIVRIAAGDLGAPAYKKFDLEYWSPIENEYRELMSCSNVTDYQARRLGIRYRQADGKPAFAHTLNGTAAAFSRTFIALVENHQQEDGSVRVPEALQKYYGRNVL
jgi:seryl-tRNA synthetase